MQLDLDLFDGETTIDLFYNENIWRDGDIFFPNVMTRSVSPSLCGSACHGNLAKLITLSGSRCRPCHPIPELSPVSLTIFSLQAQGRALCLFIRSFLFWGRLSWAALTDLCRSHLPSTPLPAHSLPPTACLSRTAQHTQGTQHTTCWSQSKRKSMEGGFFLFWKREVGKKSSPENLVYYFRGKTVRWNLTVCRETNWQPKMLRN